MLVSVVINNYNYARFVNRAIDSALAQRDCAVEVVVVDDGSTDSSAAIIQSYGHRIVPVFQSNGGMAAAINAGFRNSQGEVVIFLDSDDELLPDAARNSADAVSDGSVRVQWQMEVIDRHGNCDGTLMPAEAPLDGDLRDEVIRNGPMIANGPPTSGNAWSRALLEKILPIPERDLRQHADAYLNTLASLYGTVRMLPQPQGRYRVHGDNDYATQPLIERLRRNLRMYHYRCRLLSNALAEEGIHIDPNDWKRENVPSYYTHLRRRFAVLQDISMVLPSGSKLILVDDGAFGAGALAPHLDVVRFPATAGTPHNSPVDDTAAIGQLEAMRANGAGYAAFTKPALWWLRHFDGLRHHLETSCTAELITEAVSIFNLTTPPRTGVVPDSATI